MTALELKDKFQSQLNEATLKIIKIEEDLSNVKEYKTKLVGALEALELLLQQVEEIKAEE